MQLVAAAASVAKGRGGTLFSSPTTRGREKAEKGIINLVLCSQIKSTLEVKEAFHLAKILASFKPFEMVNRSLLEPTRKVTVVRTNEGRDAAAGWRRKAAGEGGERDSPRRRRRRALWYMVLFTEKQEGGKGGLFREGGKSATILLFAPFVCSPRHRVRPSVQRTAKKERNRLLSLSGCKCTN